MKAKTVGIGMSGGVDSSVAALLLKQAGYEVVGITMILKPDAILSAAEKARVYREAEDAAAVCAKLGIRHLVPDFSGIFEEKVIAPFAKAYFAGLTPNPCILCNQNLKFGQMLDYALAKGCDAVATGHYARVERGEGGRYLLKRADSRKDQSYFLYGLTQRQLAHSLFPMYGLEKAEARALARQHGLPVAEKADSQEICFVPNGGYIPFIEGYLKREAPPGPFLSQEGEALGTHTGIYKYTIGQRKGLGVTFGEPRYVTAIDARRNTVTLGREGSQYRGDLMAHSLNFIPFDRLTGPMAVQAKVRYQARPADAVLRPAEEGLVQVAFAQPQRSVTPGQAVVFYSGDLVVGGGIIR